MIHTIITRLPLNETLLGKTQPIITLQPMAVRRARWTIKFRQTQRQKINNQFNQLSFSNRGESILLNKENIKSNNNSLELILLNCSEIVTQINYIREFIRNNRKSEKSMAKLAINKFRKILSIRYAFHKKIDETIVADVITLLSSQIKDHCRSIKLFCDDINSKSWIQH